MQLWEGLVFGVIQGIAEFLPISSSGHLALAHLLFGASENALAFDVLLHLATLCAVCIVYYRDILLMIKGFFSLVGKLFGGRIRSPLEYGEKLFIMIAIASIPLILAAILEDFVSGAAATAWLIGALLIINGGILFISDRLAKGNVTIESAGFKLPLYVGIVQMFAILPGISRSGSTITGGLICGLERRDAVKFSFLMSFPAILGACVLKLPDFFKGGIPANDALPIFVGAVAALITGFCAIKLLQFIADKKKFGWFSIYCIIVGITAIVYDILA